MNSFERVSPSTLPIDFGGPDSELCRQAEALLRALSPPFLAHHCMRTHAFAKSVAIRDGMKVDWELLHVASLLHDLGLTEAHSGPMPFELRGAQAARDWCKHQGVSDDRAAIVHEAIALHASLSAMEKEPEIALVHIGAGCDVIGLHLDQLPPDTVEQIVAEWPRLNFKKEFSNLLDRELQARDDSAIAMQWKQGFRKAICAAPFCE